MGSEEAKAARREYMRNYVRAYRAANPELWRKARQELYARNKAERRNPKTWPRAAVREARQRAKKLKLPFDISAEDIKVPARCPITLKPFVFGEVGAEQSPSLDRIVPEKGYVKGNVRVISRIANTMKQGCVNSKIFERLAKYVEGKL